MSTKVYGLFTLDDPTIIRYVGQTKLSISRRLILHKNQSKNATNHTPVGQWIQKHRGQIGIRVLKENAERNTDEIKMISKFRKLGIKLLNVTDGGDGNAFIELSKEHKQKISEALKGKPKSKEHIENFRKARTGKGLWTDERKKSHSQKTKGKKTKQWKRRMSVEECNQLAMNRGSKPFTCIDIRTSKEIGKWCNIAQCARDLKLHETSIRNILKNKQQTTKNYTFNYLGK